MADDLQLLSMVTAGLLGLSGVWDGLRAALAEVATRAPAAVEKTSRGFDAALDVISTSDEGGSHGAPSSEESGKITYKGGEWWKRELEPNRMGLEVGYEFAWGMGVGRGTWDPRLVDGAFSVGLYNRGRNPGLQERQRAILQRWEQHAVGPNLVLYLL